MNDRIPLSLSPTGGGEHAWIEHVPVESLAHVIAFHEARARRLRSEAMWCLIRQAWQWLRRRDVRPCPDAALLNPA